MTAMPHLQSMEWDFNDQLRVTSRQAGHTNERTYYVYDAGGERVRKVTDRQNGTRKEERIYLGGFEIYREYNNNGSTPILERETLHVMDDTQRIAMVETKTKDNVNDTSPRQLTRYQFGNHLSSASLELDDSNNANPISYEEYHPYGTTAYQAVNKTIKATAKRYRYTGMERDEESGLNYHGARYYASWLGRWTSADPIGIDDGISVYQYVENNPIKFTDIEGLQGREKDISEPVQPQQKRPQPIQRSAKQPRAQLQDMISTPIPANATIDINKRVAKVTITSGNVQLTIRILPDIQGNVPEKGASATTRLTCKWGQFFTIDNN
jgi:RHS repeat-associated protein